MTGYADGSQEDVTFFVDGDHLVRRSVPYGGVAYEHRCDRKTFEQVAHAVENLGVEGFALEQMAGGERVPRTRAGLALDFLKERGIVTTRHRWNYAKPGAHLHAMTEYFALEYAGQGIRT